MIKKAFTQYRTAFLLCEVLLIFYFAVKMMSSDSFYSPYLIVAFLALSGRVFHWEKSGFGEKWGEGIALFFSSVFSVAVVLANYRIFVPFGENLSALALTLLAGVVCGRCVLLFLSGVSFPLREGEKKKNDTAEILSEIKKLKKAISKVLPTEEKTQKKKTKKDEQ